MLEEPSTKLHQALGQRIGPTMEKRDSAAAIDQSRGSLLLGGAPMALTMGFPFQHLHNNEQRRLILDRLTTKPRRTQNEHDHRKGSNTDLFQGRPGRMHLEPLGQFGIGVIRPSGALSGRPDPITFRSHLPAPGGPPARVSTTTPASGWRHTATARDPRRSLPGCSR